MPLLYTLAITDGGGDIFPVRFYVNEAQANTPAIQNTIAFRLWDYAAPLLSGSLNSIRISRNVDISGYNLAGRPSVLSDVEEKVKIGVAYQGVDKKNVGSITLPTIEEVFFLQSGASPILNVDHAYVAQYLAILKLAYGSGGVSLVNAHNEPLVETFGGEQAFG